MASPQALPSMESEDLLAVRMVAEYAYCPRLFYYEAVEGIFLPSSDTEQGDRVHRRVDQPSQAASESEDEPGRPRSVRSFALTSIKLGITGTLDLAEIAGKVAVPVEYRKGRPKHLVMSPPPDDPLDAESNLPLHSAEPWPTDRVQVALQALLLEEAGYEVREAVLYYASEKSRLTVAMDERAKSEALEVLEAARTSMSGARPAPLVSDSRCIRCSLQPICLPDEVNQQRLEEGIKARQIWPPREDGIQLVAQTEGAKIGVRGASLRVTDKNGVLLREVPMWNVESVAVLGSVQVSTQALQTLADHGVPVAYLTSAGRLVAMVDPLDSVSAQVRQAQVRRFDDPAATLALSRALVAAKIVNQRTLIQRNHPALPSRVAEEMAVEAERAAKAESMGAVRGHEGQAAALYFENFAGMFKSPLAAEFQTNGRQRRPPPDPINTCLSFAYTMLTNDCVSALRQARLEPSSGAFHVPRPNRPALALDLMEPFRPLIADSVAISAFNRGELTEGHFLRTAAGCAFTESGRKAFFQAYARRMETQITHPVFGYKLSYRRMLVLHARMIAAWLTGDVPSLAFLTTR